MGDWIATFVGSHYNDDKFSLTGTCPHCHRSAVFTMVTNAHSAPQYMGTSIDRYALWAAMQCVGCRRYLLATVWKSKNQNPPISVTYSVHYPIGKPDDDVAEEIPGHIAADFKEALRCRYVDAYNATVEMCRRAVQASCLQLGAPDGKLVTQIDWLASKGTITSPLKEMAHRVRLGGNLGAHPPEDPDDPSEIVIDGVYADAVIEFTNEFFQHVYVMPDRLSRFTFKKVTP